MLKPLKIVHVNEKTKTNAAEPKAVVKKLTKTENNIKTNYKLIKERNANKQKDIGKQ